jgi:magnesium chelatase family protein
LLNGATAHGIIAAASSRGIAARMVARVRTVAFQGVDVLGVDVQVQMAGGLPAFMML